MADETDPTPPPAAELSEEPAVEPDVVELFEQGNEFQRVVNDVLNEQFGGDVTSPEWFEYCRQMDEWNAAVAADTADAADEQ